MVEAIEVIDFEELKEVHGKKLKSHAQMLPKDYIVLDVDHVHYVVSVMLTQVL